MGNLSRDNFGSLFEVGVVNVRVRDRNREKSRLDTEFFCEKVGEKRESGSVVRVSEHQIVRANDEVEVQTSADDLDGKSVRAGDIFLFCPTGESVVARIPHQNHAVAGGGIFFEKLDQSADLIASEMFSPAVAVRGFDAVVFFGEIVPDFCKILEESEVFVAHQKPNLLRDENFERDFSKREDRKTFFEVEFHRHPRQRATKMPGARVFFQKSAIENLAEQGSVLNIKFVVHHRDFS